MVHIELKAAILPAMLAAVLITVAPSCSWHPPWSGAAFLVRKGEQFMAEKRYQDAWIEFQKALNADPASVEALVGLAHADIAMANSDEAYSTMSQAVELAPNRLDLQLDMGRMDLARRRFAKANATACLILRQQPQNIAAQRLEGAALLGLREYMEAQRVFSELVREIPTDADAELDLALANEGVGNWVKAEGEFEAAMRLRPRNSRALSVFADFCLGRGLSSRARIVVARYVSQYPDDPTAHVILGSLDNDAREFDRAKTEFARALHFNPRLVEAYLQIGHLDEEQGKLNEAIRAYKEGLTLEPAFAPLTTLIGNLYLQLGNFEAARSYYQRALSADPDFAIASANLAWVYVKQESNLDTALELAQRAERLMPGLDSIKDTLGLVYYEKGIYPRAVTAFNECVANVPRNPLYHYHLGLALLAMGSKQQGRQEIQTALRMNLKGEDVQEATSELPRVN